MLGGGFSAVAIAGGEASGGVAFNPGSFRNPGLGSIKPNIGVFASTGPGRGFNISAELFIGFISGNIEDIANPTCNLNLSLGFATFTIFTDPKNGEVLGGTFGVSPVPRQLKVEHLR